MSLKPQVALLLFVFSISSFQGNAQLFKRKNKQMANVKRFSVQTVPSAKDRARANERKRVNPIRKQLNRFNLSIEQGGGYFQYRNKLENVLVVESPTGEAQYLIPVQEAPLTFPVEGLSSWFTQSQRVTINQLDPDSQIILADTSNYSYKNNGWVNPLVFRLSLSIKKTEKGRLDSRGRKAYSDEDLVRIGGGIGFGTQKFKSNINQQEIDSGNRQYQLAETSFKTSKAFGSITYPFYRLGDFSAQADVLAGIWKFKEENLTVNTTDVTYDPFVDLGVIFQKQFSKYFKGYIRPGLEYRKYNLSLDNALIPHQFMTFSLSVGLLLKYPIYPRNRYKADQVQMEHVFNGKMYRGRPFYRKQNPRYGQNRIKRKPSR